MKLIWKISIRILVVLGLLLVIVGLFGEKTEPPPNTTEEPPIDRRLFLMGAIPIPKQPLTTENWIEVFDLLGKNADVVLHHTSPDWEQFVDSNSVERNAAVTSQLESTNFIVEMAKRENLKLFIVVDPLRADREEIDSKLPLNIGKNFGDENVRKAFKNYALRIARDYKPKYLGLGSEVNTYIT